jgi:NAD(P)-dependent dehydrogenase (short-subunit alcohol dehydrogenase family)
VIHSFVGKPAWIVGGTSGMGKAVAGLLLQRGATTVLGKNPAKLRAAQHERGKLGSFGNVIACNATSPTVPN